MKKLSLCALAIVLMIVASCGITVDPVKAASLNDFTGDTATTKEEAVASASMGVLAIYSSVGSATISDETAAELKKFAPALSLLEKLAPADSLNQIKSKMRKISSRAISEDAKANDDDPTDDGVANYKVTLTDEGFGAEGLNVNGTLSYNLSGYPYGDSVSFPVNMKAEAACDLKSTLEEIADSAFNGGAANVAAKIEGSGSQASAEADPVIKGTVEAALSAGFSLDADDTYGTKGGKYLLTLKYKQSLNLTYGEDVQQQILDGLEFELTIAVYDNANKKTFATTYTQDDLAASMEAMESM